MSMCKVFALQWVGALWTVATAEKEGWFGNKETVLGGLLVSEWTNLASQITVKFKSDQGRHWADII